MLTTFALLYVWIGLRRGVLPDANVGKAIVSAAAVVEIIVWLVVLVVLAHAK